jgi:hypothetical protein
VTTLAPAAAPTVLAPAELRQIVRDTLRSVLPGSRVLAVISDRTRDDNTDLLFPMISQELAAVGAASLDALVAQGTHPAMSDADKRAKIGAGRDELPLLGSIFDHHWDTPSELVTLGSLSKSQVSLLTEGLMADEGAGAAQRPARARTLRSDPRHRGPRCRTKSPASPEARSTSSPASRAPS